MNVYGRKRRAVNSKLEKIMSDNMSAAPVVLNDSQRAVVTEVINEVCRHRNYGLCAVSVRTNHTHVAVSAQSKPEPIAAAFRRDPRRKRRGLRLIGEEVRPWDRGKSRRYLWKP